MDNRIFEVFDDGNVRNGLVVSPERITVTLKNTSSIQEKFDVIRQSFLVAELMGSVDRTWRGNFEDDSFIRLFNASKDMKRRFRYEDGGYTELL